MTPTALCVLALALAAEPAPPPRPVVTDRFGDRLPDGAVLRLGSIGFKVPDVVGVGFRANGELVALSRKLILYTWPPDGTATPKTLVVSDRPVWYRQALSPDGRFVAASMGGKVVVWDVSGPRPVEVLTRAADGVYQLTFSPDGNWLAVNEAGVSIGRVLLGHLPTRRWRELSTPVTHVESFAFSADGKRLAVVNRADVAVIDTADGKELARVPTPARFRPRWAALSPAGDMLAVVPLLFTGDKPPAPLLLSMPSGKPADDLTAPPPGSAAWAAFSPDGKTLLLGGDEGVREWDPEREKVVRSMSGPARFPPVYSPDRKRVAGHSYNAVLVWDAATGKPLRPDVADAGHHDSVMGVTVSPDGRLVATDSLDGEVIVWSAETGRPLWRRRAPWNNDRHVVFTPDSKLLLAVADDRITPVVCDAATGREVRRFGVPADWLSKETTQGLRLSADGKVLTTDTRPNLAGRPGYAVRWDVAAGAPLDRTEQPRNLGFPDFSPSYSPDGRWMVLNGRVTRIGASDSFELVPPTDPGSVPARFSPDSRLVAQPRRLPLAVRLQTPGKYDPATDSTVVFELASRRKVAELPTGQALRLEFSPDGRCLAVVGRDAITLWELATGKPLRRFAVPWSVMVRKEAIAFTPDGRRLVTGHDDCTALVWDVTGTHGSPRAAADLARCWDALAGADAVAADRAAWELADRPAQAVPFLRGRLKPVRPTPAAEAAALVAKLDAAAFDEREAAERDLRRLGDAAGPGLRHALRGNVSAEQRQRIETVLRVGETFAPPAGEPLRVVRAVAAAERMRTAEAKALLAEWARGLGSARLTREAKAALARLAGPRSVE